MVLPAKQILLKQSQQIIAGTDLVHVAGFSYAHAVQGCAGCLELYRTAHNCLSTSEHTSDGHFCTVTDSLLADCRILRGRQ